MGGAAEGYQAGWALTWSNLGRGEEDKRRLRQAFLKGGEEEERLICSACFLRCWEN